MKSIFASHRLKSTVSYVFTVGITGYLQNDYFLGPA